MQVDKRQPAARPKRAVNGRVGRVTARDTEYRRAPDTEQLITDYVLRSRAVGLSAAMDHPEAWAGGEEATVMRCDASGLRYIQRRLVGSRTN